MFYLDEPNWEEQRLAIVNLGRMMDVYPGGRHQIVLQNVLENLNADEQEGRNRYFPCVVNSILN